MSIELASQGSLFTPDYLTDSIQNDNEWNELAEADLSQIREQLNRLFDAFQIDQLRTEADTETELIVPVSFALLT